MTCMWNEEFVAIQTDSSCRLLPSPRVALSFSQPFPSAGTSCRSAAASATPGWRKQGAARLSPAEDNRQAGPGRSNGPWNPTRALCLSGVFSSDPKCMRTVCCLISSVCSADAQCTSYFFPVHLVFQHSGAAPEVKNQLYKITLTAFCSRRQVLQYFLEKCKWYFLSSLSNPMHISRCSRSPR